MTEDRIRWCRHHTKPSPMCDGCEIGVDVEVLVGKFGMFGRFFLLPCHDKTHPEVEKPACPVGGPEWFTLEEIKQRDAEIERDTQRFLARLLDTQPLLAEIKSGTAAKGSCACPVCGSGSVSWSMGLINRHVRMMCSTDDCINFME